MAWKFTFLSFKLTKNYNFLVNLSYLFYYKVDKLLKISIKLFLNVWNQNDKK